MPIGVVRRLTEGTGRRSRDDDCMCAFSLTSIGSAVVVYDQIKWRGKSKVVATNPQYSDDDELSILENDCSR